MSVKSEIPSRLLRSKIMLKSRQNLITVWFTTMHVYVTVCNQQIISFMWEDTQTHPDLITQRQTDTKTNRETEVK